MLKNHLKTVALIFTAALMATSVSAADAPDAGVDRSSPPAPDSAATNRNLAREATTAAAEDAIEAVLIANRLHLDIRLNGRTSGRTSDESVSGR